jgi:hypothetical protein
VPAPFTVLNVVIASSPRPSSTTCVSWIAREKFAADLHMDVSIFDQPAWDVSGLRHRGTIRENPTLYFTRRGTLDQPLPAAYGDIVKCWLILDRRSVANMSRRLDAARILWEAIQRRRKGKAEAFMWQNFSEEDLSQAELLMRAGWSDSTTYKLIISLLVFARFLAARAGAAIEQDYFKGEIRKLTEELEKERERSKGLVGHIAIMEANAARLGFDPEDVHKPILKPVRTISRAGTGKPKPARQFTS